MKDRITPDNILALKDNEIFVFGSNMAGMHGAGAALSAVKKFGAINGRGEGLYGNSYALPTKNRNIVTLPIKDIAPKVARLIRVAQRNPKLIFLVTEVGCGLAGYYPKDIAPLFSKAIDVKNIHLPERFWTVLNSKFNQDNGRKSKSTITR
jgi:hypothetical protein